MTQAIRIAHRAKCFPFASPRRSIANSRGRTLYLDTVSGLKEISGASAKVEKGSAFRVPSGEYHIITLLDFSPAIVKVPEQVGAAKSARRKVGNRIPRKGFLFQENHSEQPNPHGARLGTGFPGRGSQARFPGTGSQVRFPRGSQEQAPKQGFPASSQARFPGRGSQRGSQARFPGKVTRNRFPSKGSQQEVPKQGSQEEVTKEEVPRQGSGCNDVDDDDVGNACVVDKACNIDEVDGQMCRWCR